LIKFTYETTPLVPTGGEHILPSSVIDYISVWPMVLRWKFTYDIVASMALETTLLFA